MLSNSLTQSLFSRSLFFMPLQLVGFLFTWLTQLKKNKNVWIATLCFYSLIVCCVFVCCHRATGEGGMNREEAPGKSPEDMYIQQKVRVLLMLKKMGSNVGRLSRPAATASEPVLSESAEQ